MTLWKSTSASLATSGTTTQDWSATGVSIDSRTVAAGDLFIAIVGEKMDGHAFVKQALEKGAAAAMVTHVPDGVASDAPLLLVEDTMEALWALARYRREHLTGKVVMVTGSVGKTSTKEMLAHTLEHQGKTYATTGNLNNHYGLPLTLARTPADCDFVVLEVGMNHANEISPLSVLGKPDVAIITTVEPVHLEFFDSVEGIADAKAEVFDGMEEEGTAILNRDNPHFLRLQQAVLDRGIRTQVSFGKTQGAQCQLLSYKDHAEGAEVQARLGDVPLSYKLGIAGEHQALNSLAVLAAVKALGGDPVRAAKSLANFEAKSGRGKRIHLALPFGDITLIDDTYNASPASVKAAIKVLADIKAAQPCRTVVVLGDMFELGDGAEQMHQSLRQTLEQYPIDVVCTAGKLMHTLHNQLANAQQGPHAPTSAELAPEVAKILKAGDVVLVKGSRGMRMENVVKALIEKGHKHDAV